MGMRLVRLLTMAVAAVGVGAESQPRFLAADVHVSAKALNPVSRNAAGRGGRYELKNATMVDLVRIAYAVSADKVVGGPSWLELDRFDVIAKMPPNTSAEDRQQMLQTLLAERFGLAARNTTQPMPGYALTVPQKALMKEADGQGDSGCRPGGSGDSGGAPMVMMINGQQQTLSLGPGGTLQIVCRNMTMAAFAGAIRSIAFAPQLGPNPILDDTGLKGAWTFDWRFALRWLGDREANPFFDALEKQTGLKLAKRQVPVEVIVVEKVNRTPTPNPPGTEKELPELKQPTEFEVADVKLGDPATPGIGRIQNQPGGRFVAQGVPMISYLMHAFNVNRGDMIVGIPGWARTDRFDITAKAPMDSADAPEPDNDAINAMIRALLVERFKLAWHTEEREVSAYSLVSVKPRMKKADPARRTFCKPLTELEGGAPGVFTWRCQNITMDEFADRMQNLALGTPITWPVKDETAIDGGWDFTLGFNPNAPGSYTIPRPASDGANNPASMAADPGGLPTFFQALERLGLKLESRKRQERVIVIDHLERRTEN
jgi:uncharacterized protein (TIGR03435 family)